MELPNLGKHCSEKTCNKLDFLPIKCDVCKEIFCDEHYHYTTHNCPNAYKKDNQVPVCPLCNTPIPVGRGQQPDFAVGAHIDNDCQSDPAKSRRAVFTNKCSRKGCKGKEVIPVVCSDCTLNFCLKHRHPTDHNCTGPKPKTSKLQQLRDFAQAKRSAQQNQSESSVSTRQTPAQPNRNMLASVQGTMSEDEALAMALALSMQEEQDQQTNSLHLQNLVQTEVGGRRNANRDRCHIS